MKARSVLVVESEWEEEQNGLTWAGGLESENGNGICSSRLE